MEIYKNAQETQP